MYVRRAESWICNMRRLKLGQILQQTSPSSPAKLLTQLHMHSKELLRLGYGSAPRAVESRERIWIS